MRFRLTICEVRNTLCCATRTYQVKPFFLGGDGLRARGGALVGFEKTKGTTLPSLAVYLAYIEDISDILRTNAHEPPPPFPRHPSPATLPLPASSSPSVSASRPH